MSQAAELFGVLGIREDSSDEEIKYYAQRKLKVTSDPMERARITVAEQVLLDPDKRAEMAINEALAVDTYEPRSLTEDEVKALDTFVTSTQKNNPTIVNNYYGSQNYSWSGSLLSFTIAAVVAFLTFCGLLGMAM